MVMTGADRFRRLVKGLRLYVLSSADLALELTHEDVLETSTVSGATAVEFSVRGARTTDLVSRGTPLRALASARSVLFFVLNDVDAAVGLRADGVFLEGARLGVKDARKVLGRDMYIGTSAGSVREALRAQAEGADFVRLVAKRGGAGTSPDATIIRRTASSVRIPVTAPEPPVGALEAVFSAGAAGVTVRERLLRAPDIESYCLRLRAAVERAAPRRPARSVRPARQEAIWQL